MRRVVADSSLFEASGKCALNLPISPTAIFSFLYMFVKAVRLTGESEILATREHFGAGVLLLFVRVNRLVADVGIFISCTMCVQCVHNACTNTVSSE